jgi:hypothetical protein
MANTEIEVNHKELQGIHVVYRLEWCALSNPGQMQFLDSGNSGDASRGRVNEVVIPGGIHTVPMELV